MDVAVIGCGALGALHLARWAEVSGARVSAVCDPDAAAATRAAAEFGQGATAAHTDWRATLDTPGLDAVDICAPLDSHAAIATAAAERGLAVLCERPFAGDAAAAARMAEAAETAGRLLMPAFCHRFHPPVLFAKELIDSDDLGRIVMFRARFSASAAAAGVGESWEAEARPTGGALLRTGMDAIDLFRYLVDEVESATGNVSAAQPGIDAEDSAAAVLKGGDGALGVVEASWATPAGRSLVEVYGTAGGCMLDYDTGQLRFKTADMPVWETREVGGSDRYLREILHFADVVRGLQRALVSAADGVRANEIVAAIYASSAGS